MATTRYSYNVVGPLLKTAKFGVTADNDTLLADGDFLVLGCVFEGLATAVNIDAGLDITVFPAVVANTETLDVTTTGAGSVTVLFVEMPDAGYTTLDT